MTSSCRTWLLVVGLTVVGTLPASEGGVNLVRNGSFEAQTGNQPAGWHMKTWAGSGSFHVAEVGRSGPCVVIESAGEGGDVSWGQVVAVKPNTTYRLTGWIKTEAVEPGGGTGALLSVHELQRAASTRAVTGHTDWTRVESILRSGEHSSLQVHCLLGGWGLSKGKAWYDDIMLEEIDLAALPLAATIRVKDEGARINPFIYGQFIEHLGRCIYGGIWAEMLEDRKFYFAVTPEYDPYKSLQDSRFPVVGASPWEMTGAANTVSMTATNAFVGDHAPEIARGGGIRQRDLALVKGKDYTGYIWLKGHSAGDSVTVSLAWGEDDRARKSEVLTLSDGYRKYPLRFRAGATTDKAEFTIRVSSGTCWVGTASLMPADNVKGMRADTLKLLKQLDAPMYRWPGGNFVSGYDWRDGIGDRDRRPPRRNPAWTGVEHNDFGLDEFIDFCREVKAEPLIAVNTGFGDAYSAAQEVEYCNGGVETVGGGWRAENGHLSPYGVKYWCVGNEMFGPWQLGFMQLKHYTQKHNRVARAMKRADPSIESIGVGDLGRINKQHDPSESRGWSRGMLEQCADHMDYLSEHFYCGRQKDIVAHVQDLAGNIRRKAEGHRKMQARLGNLDGRIVPIAMDEWNYWHRNYVYGELGCTYDLADALGVAVGLHEFFRQSDIMQMAHYAQTVNVIGCIKTTKTGAFLATTALPLMLYRKEFGVVPVSVTGNHSLLDVDVVAALSEDRQILTIGIVNPNRETKHIALTLDGGTAQESGTVSVIAGDDPAIGNDVDHARVAVKTESASFTGSLKSPGLSISLYRFPVR